MSDRKASISGTSAYGILASVAAAVALLGFAPRPAVAATAIEGCLVIWARILVGGPAEFAPYLEVGDKKYIIEIASGASFDPPTMDRGGGSWKPEEEHVYQVTGDVLPGKAVAGQNFDFVLRASAVRKTELECGEPVDQAAKAAWAKQSPTRWRKLVKFGGPGAIDFLVPVLRDDKADVNLRYHAAEALGDSSNERAEGALAELAKTTDSESLRQAATESLEKIRKRRVR